MRVFLCNDSGEEIHLRQAPPDSADQQGRVRPGKTRVFDIRGPDVFVKVWDNGVIMITSCDVDYMQGAGERLPGLVKELVEKLRSGGIDISEDNICRLHDETMEVDG